MKIKHLIAASAFLLVTQFGCRLASFENVDQNAKTKNDSGEGDAVPEHTGDSKPELPSVPATPVATAPAPVPAPTGDGDGNPDQNENQNQNQNPIPNPPVVVKPVLTVTLPSPEIKAGGNKIPATAILKDQVEPPVVTWTITGPADRTDIGSIDTNGVYTSPKTNDKEFPITVIATLVSDPTVIGTAPLNVLPIEQIFARCTRGNMVFPILAQVYQVNSTITMLPNFSNTAEARKITTVCMDKYAVAPRNFSTGFPDVPGLYEYFALQTTTTLVVPEEGDYWIEVNSDDGAKVSIDGALVLNNDGLHQARGTSTEDSQTAGNKEVKLHLLKGDHPLTLDYFQGPQYRLALELKWKRPGRTSYEYIPTQNFK